MVYLTCMVPSDRRMKTASENRDQWRMKIGSSAQRRLRGLTDSWQRGNIWII